MTTVCLQSHRYSWRKFAYDMRVCNNFDPRSLEGKVQNCHPVCIFFFMEKHWKFFLYTKIAFYMMMCNDFDPGSFEQVQGHWKERVNKELIICVRSISFLWRNIGLSYFTLKLHMTWGYVLILNQVHLDKSRSLEGEVQNLCPIFIFLIEKYWKFLLHTMIAFNLRVVMIFTQGHYSKFKVIGKKS